MGVTIASMESHESCKLDLETASEEASRLFVEIYEKLETRKVDPGIDFKSLVELFRESLKDEGVGLLEALRDFREKVVPNCLAIPHPLYLGLVNSSPLTGRSSCRPPDLGFEQQRRGGAASRTCLRRGSDPSVQGALRAAGQLERIDPPRRRIHDFAGSSPRPSHAPFRRSKRMGFIRSEEFLEFILPRRPTLRLPGLQRRLELANGTWSAFPVLAEAASTFRASKSISEPIGGKGIFLLQW